jgi:adenylate cyclase
MAAAMRSRVAELSEGWHRLGHDLGFGVGIAQGFATLGRVGFEGRYDYAAIGTVTNLSARLCGEAAAGQILVTQRVLTGAGDIAVSRAIGSVALRGFSRAVEAYEILGLDAAKAVS